MPHARYLADRLRAHARLYRHIAEEMWNEDKAQELERLADECAYAADSLALAEADIAKPQRLQFHGANL